MEEHMKKVTFKQRPKAGIRVGSTNLGESSIKGNRKGKGPVHAYTFGEFKKQTGQ